MTSTNTFEAVKQRLKYKTLRGLESHLWVVIPSRKYSKDPHRDLMILDKTTNKFVSGLKYRGELFSGIYTWEMDVRNGGNYFVHFDLGADEVHLESQEDYYRESGRLA